MFIIFNKDGSIFAKTQSDYVMQGSNRVNKVYVGFVDNDYYQWTCNGVFNLPNGTRWTVPGVSVREGFDYLGVNYKGWTIDLTDDITKYDGKVSLTVQVVNSDTAVLFTYLANITINRTGLPIDGYWDNSITIAQFNDYMAQLAVKLQANTVSVVVSENDLPDVGEKNILYFIVGESSNTPYQVKMWNGSEYVLLGTINLSSFASKEEQKVFEQQVLSQIGQIRSEVVNPFDVVSTTQGLPSTDQHKLYIVLANNHWYYWNGTQYTDGGAFIDSGITIENLEGQFSELGQALYDYIEERFNNGDHRPFTMRAESIQDWQGNPYQDEPLGNVFGWYDEFNGDVVIVASVGIFVLQADYITAPRIEDIVLAVNVNYDNEYSGLTSKNIQGAIDELNDVKAEITTEIGVNKLDLNTITRGAFLGNNGSISTYASTSYSDFTKIKIGDVVIYRKCIGTGSNQQGCYYDTTYNFVSGINSSNSTTSTVNGVDVISFVSPIDGYIRINVDNSALTTTMLVINTDYPTSFISFEKNVILMPLELSNETVEGLEDTFFPEPEFVNIFNGNYEAGKFINREGTIYESSGYGITEYISIKPSERFIVPRTTSYNFSYVVCLFDENYNVITIFADVKSVVSNGRDCWEISVPNINTIKYARFTLQNPDTFMIIKGLVYPDYYVEYNNGERLINNAYKLNETQLEQVKDFATVSNLYGKKMACCGDSIMESRISGEKANGGAWAKVIGDKNNMIVNNIAVSGSRLSDTATGRTPIYAQLQSLENIYDYLCFDGGVNDFASNIPLGEITTIYSSDITSYDTTTILGGLESLCSLLVFQYQTAKKLFVFNHRIYGNSSTAEAGTWGNLIIKMKEVLKKWGISYIDLEKEAAPINLLGTDFKDTYTTLGDGWHPNELGYRTFYVDKIEAKLKEL